MWLIFRVQTDARVEWSRVWFNKYMFEVVEFEVESKSALQMGGMEQSTVNKDNKPLNCVFALGSFGSYYGLVVKFISKKESILITKQYIHLLLHYCGFSLG